MGSAIDKFLKKIEEDLMFFRNGYAVMSTGRAEDFLMDYGEEIEKESPEVYQLAFDVQTEFA